MRNPYGMNDFQWKMFNLDIALTGESSHCDRHAGQMRNKPKSVEEWYNRPEWYLSDGGYSRIWLDEDGHIFLTSNSTDKTKAAWERCIELRNDVETLTKAFIRSLQEKNGKTSDAR